MRALGRNGVRDREAAALPSVARAGRIRLDLSKISGVPVIEFVVPGPPQGKGRHRVGRVGGDVRMFTPAKTAAYEGLVALVAKQAMAGMKPLDEAVAVRLQIDCAVPKSWSKRRQDQALAGELRPTGKPDLDNVLKAIADGCNGIVWRDDACIVSAMVAKLYGAAPGVTVRVSALSWVDE